MKINNRERIGRILFGIFILSLLIILIVPKNTQKKPKNSAAPQITQHTITLSGTGFNPQTITIKKGEAIVWTNKSRVRASVNSAEYPTHQLFPILNLGAFNNGQNLQAIFKDAGEFKYVNHFIPSQTGTVIVK